MIHDKRRFSIVLLALAVAFAPHLLRVPMWVSTFVVLTWGYSLAMQYRGWPVCPRWIRIFLALGCLFVVVSTFGRNFGRDAGVALLSLMLGLKAVESKSVRDVLALAFLAYFVVVTNVLYAQSLLMSAYMFFSVLVVTGALVHLHSSEADIWPDVRRGGMLLVQALPLAVLLFFFFPRLQGALWGVHDERDEAGTAFSDTLEPGSVAGLSLSREVVFRVDFSSPIPDRQDLYWRGVVLDSFDGIRWSKQYVAPALPAAQAVSTPNDIAYTLTLEPHDSIWLFALDRPLLAPEGTALGPDGSLSVQQKLRSRTRYGLISGPAVLLESEPANYWTALPESGNPRARTLAAEWTRLESQEIVAKILELFQVGFVYSLRPGPLEGDLVDRFLFDAREGFCEHYASAMTFLLRAAHVPARIVVGYQGGEGNPLGGYLIVRQSEAHAWVEVWLNGQWERVDPTSVVALRRLTLGAEAVVQAQGMSPERARLLRQMGRFFQMSWDTVNNSWNQWVLGFSHERQRGLWERLGFDPMRQDGALKLALLLSGSLGCVMGGVIWAMLRSRRVGTDKVAELYARFCRQMTDIGLGRKPGEGPMAHLERIAQMRRDLLPAASKIVHEYVRLRYQQQDGDTRRLEQLVRAFGAAETTGLFKKTWHRAGKALRARMF